MEFQRLKEENRHGLNSFIAKNKGSQFLQSFYWHDILKSENKPVEMWSLIDNRGKYLLSFLIIFKNSRFFNYAYLPRGPIVAIDLLADKDKLKEVMVFWEKEMQRKFTQLNFIRLEPDFNYKSSLKQEQTLAIQPQKTLLIDLSQSEEDILKGMHHKTRYNIRLSHKKGVKIKEGTTNDDFENFWQLLNTTQERNSFGLHPKKHYEKIFMASKSKIKLLVAEFEGKTIAGGLFSFFGDQATYLHGASSNYLRSLMAPYGLQWQAIKIAKEKGCKYYDFGGISETLWPGVTRFKQGFGGFEYNYPGTFDIIFNSKKYFFYKMLRAIRRRF